MSDDLWLRPASYMESLMEDANKLKCCIPCYYLRLSSVEQLTEALMRQALVHLYRKVPVMRVCVDTHEDGRLWFKGMAEMKLDFKVSDSANIPSMITNLTTTEFDSINGPLWRARLASKSKNTDEFDEKDTFLFHSDFFIAFHHSISDGTTGPLICGLLLEILEMLLLGKNPNDDIQLGKFMSDELADKTVEEVRNNIGDSEIKEIIEKGHKVMAEGKNLIEKHYSSKVTDELVNKRVWYTFSKEESAKFMQKCKAENISVHSAFTAITQAGAMELLKGKEILDRPIPFSSHEVFNCRRYYGCQNSNILGSHFKIYLMTTQVSPNVKDDVWQQAKIIHKELHDKVENREVFKQIVSAQILCENGIIEPFSYSNYTDDHKYYTSSNAGNVSKFFPTNNQLVEATSLLRTATISVNLLAAFFYQSFRGRLTYNLEYMSRYFSEEIAKKWVDSIRDILRSAI